MTRTGHASTADAHASAVDAGPQYVHEEKLLQPSRAGSTASSSSSDGQEASPALSTLDIRRKRNRDSMRRARVRQRAEKHQMQRTIDHLETHLRQLLTRAEPPPTTSAYGKLLQHTDQLRAQQQKLEAAVQQHETFQRKIGREAEQELERVQEQDLEELPDGGAEPNVDEEEDEEVPGRPFWMAAAKAQELLRFAADMFVANAECTDALVRQGNLVLGWRDKRAVLDDTWAQFLLTKDFPNESAAALMERTWDATVNAAKMRGMLKWTAGMKVLHRLSDDAYVIARELHLPNSADSDHPILYHYELLIFRASTPTGFLISTQNVLLAGGADATMSQRLDQRLLRQAGVPLVTMYGFLFERQRCELTGAEIGCRVRLAGRTSDGSLSYAHKVLTEALPSILRWENSYVGPILRITPSC
ncbi:hypothetical protein BBJ28_00025112 [Nothophytophthora sp. Chile5]|nr:hypothetical protein BBJ28_00025112 [Nothophytophthora sp. Chile5]